MTVGVQYLPYHQIDKQKWDACIETADNGLIYGYSTYLDNMASHWDALILDNYEVVMPLTWNKKYSVCYLYQPYFTAALGLFGKNITAELVNDFLSSIPAKFKYWDIYLNYANRFSLSKFELTNRVNYILPLQDSYEKLFDAFGVSHKRNIKRAAQLNCTLNRNIEIDDVIKLAEEQARDFSKATKKDYDHFKKLYQRLYSEKKATTYGVYLPSGQLVASCAFFFSNKRAYYILVGNHPNGKTIGASHYLINAFIKDNAGKDLLLDFEGSDIKSLANFYSSFGARQEMYAGLRLNRLPKIVRLLKP